MVKPLLSVIIPTFKTGKYLEKCLDSVLEQTYDELEIIVVTDGPEEDDKIAEQYQERDSRVKVVAGKKNGCGGARNIGLNVAKGEFVTFVDSDDWVEKTAYEKAVQKFVDCDVDLIVFGGKLAGYEKLFSDGLAQYITPKYRGCVNLMCEVVFNTNVQVWNKVFKKSIIDKYDIRFPEKMQYEDFPFFFEYTLVAKSGYYVPEGLYNYLQRDDSGMVQTYLKNFDYVKDHINCCYFLWDRLNKNGLFKLYSQEFSYFYAYWLENAVGHCKKQDREILCEYGWEAYEKMRLNSYGIYPLVMLERKEFKTIGKRIKNVSPMFLFGKILVGKIVEYNNSKIKVYVLGIPVLKWKKGV